MNEMLKGKLQNTSISMKFALNILRILQINYYRRLSYLDHPDIQKHGIRIAMRFSF